MYKIYEIRNKATHRVEFLNLFNATQEKPDDVFRADPESQKFANRYDLYLYVNQEDYLNLEEAINATLQLMLKYKLIPSKIEEERPNNVQSFSLGMDEQDPRRNIEAFQKETKFDIVVEEEQFKPKGRPKKNNDKDITK
jgi:tRNA A37 N6-isopentenylltransferase MiaA